MVPAPSPVRYRVATDGDEPFLWTALYNAIYLPPGADPPPMDILRRDEVARYVAGWSAAQEPGLIAETTANGTPVGAAWLRLLPRDRPGYGFVADDVPELSVAVLPQWRGRGVGTALISQLLDLARPRFAQVSLSVSTPNPARRLYHRLGFRQVGSSGDSLTMLRDLPRGK